MKSTKEFLDEAKKKYPSQYDAEFLVAYMQAINGLSTGGVSSDIIKLHHKIMTIHVPIWNKVFGDKSPWSVNTSGRKPKVVWDQSKANKLGIDDSQG